MIILEVSVIASGSEVQGHIGAPQPLRATNADSSGPSSNQMQEPAAAPSHSSAGLYMRHTDTVMLRTTMIMMIYLMLQ